MSRAPRPPVSAKQRKPTLAGLAEAQRKLEVAESLARSTLNKHRKLIHELRTQVSELQDLRDGDANDIESLFTRLAALERPASPGVAATALPTCPACIDCEHDSKTVDQYPCSVCHKSEPDAHPAWTSKAPAARPADDLGEDIGRWTSCNNGTVAELKSEPWTLVAYDTGIWDVYHVCARVAHDDKREKDLRSAQLAAVAALRKRLADEGKAKPADDLVARAERHAELLQATVNRTRTVGVTPTLTEVCALLDDALSLVRELLARVRTI